MLTFSFGRATFQQNQMQLEWKSISIIIYNTRLSLNSTKQLRKSLQHPIFLQKPSEKMGVREVMVCISWELANPINMLSNYSRNSMRGVASVYYGNVIAEAGLGLQLPFVCRYSLRLAFCSTSPTEMSSLAHPLKLQRMQRPHSCSPLSWRT